MSGYLICMRVDQEIAPIDGSIVINCHKCDGRIWVSPASLEELGETIPTCTKCAYEMMGKKPGNMERPSPKVLKEIVDAIDDPNERMDFIKFINDKEAVESSVPELLKHLHEKEDQA